MADRVGSAPTSFRVTTEGITVMLPVNKNDIKTDFTNVPKLI